MTDDRLTTDEALVLVRVNAWDRREGESTCGHTGCEDHPVTTRVIHTTMSGFGADWDIESALDAVQNARSIRWAWSLLGHDLAVEQADGKWVRFDVRAPDSVRRAWAEAAKAERAVAGGVTGGEAQ